MKEQHETYNYVVNDRYSLIQPDIKTIILNFHGLNTGEYAYMESFLYPYKFFKLYSELYDVSEKLLMNVRELCDKPDLVKKQLDLEMVDCLTSTTHTISSSNS